MGDFKFNFSSFGKPKVKKSVNSPRREVVQRNIIGVIGINLDASYYVEINGKSYTLTLESYDLIGKNVYYSKTLQENKSIQVIRLSKLKRNNNQYLPFTVGSIVKGTTYLILGLERFNITKVMELQEIPDVEYNKYKALVHKHKQFFRENYEEIKKCMG